MTVTKDEKIVYKNISLDDFVISLDRLTRFKHPSEKYPRVFKDILQKYLVIPKYTSKQIDLLPPEKMSEIVGTIWNKSIKSLFANSKKGFINSNIIKSIDRLSFEGIDAELKKLINVQLEIEPILISIAENKDLPLNLTLLVEYKKGIDTFKKQGIIDSQALFELRSKLKLKFPISKLVLTEGITEEILLPKFAKKLNYDFNEFGVYVLGSGGKSKMPSLYSKLKQTVKIPIVILLDNDASEISEFIKQNLSKKDKIILINNGEFEDIVSKNLIKRSFNNHFYDIEKVEKKELSENESMCDSIHKIYKSRGLGEFQKAHFAKILANNITYDTDISDEIKSLIQEIKTI